jgi:predicted small secreted protein
MMRYTLTLCVLLLLAACNTVQGVGRDLESAGGAVQRAVN